MAPWIGGGEETWTKGKHQSNKLSPIAMVFCRRIARKSAKNRIMNKDIKEKIQQSITEGMKNRQCRWFAYLDGT